MRYLLDTNIISDFIRNPHGKAAARALKKDPASLCTSIIVAAEMWFGAAKRRSANLHMKLSDLFKEIEVLPFEEPSELTYAEYRADLERRGLPIGANDLLIAAHARTLGATLVTDNVREFSRLKGLKVENWLR
jgi:tRNA(fMet)-specific endonuclease VapC